MVKFGLFFIRTSGHTGYLSLTALLRRSHFMSISGFKLMQKSGALGREPWSSGYGR